MEVDIADIQKEILDQYVNDENHRPWVIAFSGGKDSTVLLQLIEEFLCWRDYTENMLQRIFTSDEIATEFTVHVSKTFYQVY